MSKSPKTAGLAVFTIASLFAGSVVQAGFTLNTLVTFNGTNGEGPLVNAGVTVSGNTLYGTTYFGGAYGTGEIFSVPVSGGSPALLASFTGDNGEDPNAALTLSGDTLYGTAALGGANGNGTVFSVPAGGGSPTVLATFNGGNGEAPDGLILSGNTFYGTTYFGGANSGGTVFSLTPNPIASLTATAPTEFGSNVGSLAVGGGNGKYSVASVTIAPTPTGYVTVSGFNPSTDTETFALDVTDSVPGNLAADLADAVSEIDSGTYSGFSLTAGTVDSTGVFGGGYDFFITITDPTLGTGSPDFGFDFTQLNGISDTLSVGAVAVTGGAVPEPASLAMLVAGSVGLLGRRRVAD